MGRVKHLLDRGGLALLAAVLVCGVTLMIGALAGDRPQQVSAAPPPPPSVALAATVCTSGPAATSSARSTQTGALAVATATPTDTPTATFVAPTATPTDTPTATFVAPTATPTDTPTATFVAPTVQEPVGCWRMGESAGTTMFDSSGNGNDGTYVGGVTLNQPGAVAGDTAARYDGVNDVGRVPDDPSLDVGSSFTLEGWINRSNDAKTHTMFNKGDRGFQLVVMSGASGNQVFLRKTNITTIARSSLPVPAGAYHHVAATMNGNGSTAHIYVDGVESTVILAPTQSIQDTAFPLVFGSAASTPALFDEFALYDEALSAADIAAHEALGN